MTSGTERFSAFKLRHLQHKGELIHYVGSPCLVEEIEKRLEKNIATHVRVNQEWEASRQVMSSNYYGQGLKVDVKSGRLVISIGVDVLAHAVSYSEWANPFNEELDDHVRSFAITDPEQFAKDVMYQMLAEEEDGSTLLSNFLDKASEEAVNDGSLGLSEDEHQIKHGTFAECETWAKKPDAKRKKGREERTVNYGRAFQIVRAARGLTLADVAKKAGIGPSQLCLVENGKRSPSLGTLDATCKALNVPVLHLMVLAGGAEIEPQMAAAILKNLLRKVGRGKS